MRTSLTGLFLLVAACAGAKPPMPAEGRVAAPHPEERGRPETAVEYERILGSFTANHDAVLYLDPALCLRRCAQSAEVHAQQLEGLIEQFRRLGVPRGEAAARLNFAALLWRSGDPDRAYAQLRDAELRFGEAGDAEGLAHAHEWLGFLFHEAGAIDEAGEHLAVAYQLYLRLDDQRAASRVLDYADD